MGGFRKGKKPDQLYKRGSAKHKEMSRIARNAKAKDRGTRERLAAEVADPNKKGYDAPVGFAEKPKFYKVLYARVPADCHEWVETLCLENSTTISDVMAQLIKCAKEGVVFFMPKRFSKAEKRFYVQEITKERRLKKLEGERKALREKMLRDRDALKHSLDPDSLKV